MVISIGNWDESNVISTIKHLILTYLVQYDIRVGIFMQHCKEFEKEPVIMRRNDRNKQTVSIANIPE